MSGVGGHGRFIPDTVMQQNGSQLSDGNNFMPMSESGMPLTLSEQLGIELDEYEEYLRLREGLQCQTLSK